MTTLLREITDRLPARPVRNDDCYETRWARRELRERIRAAKAVRRGDFTLLATSRLPTPAKGVLSRCRRDARTSVNRPYTLLDGKVGDRWTFVVWDGATDSPQVAIQITPGSRTCAAFAKQVLRAMGYSWEHERHFKAEDQA